MNTQTITVNKVDFDVKFGIKSDLILAEMWDCKKPSEVFAKIQTGFDLKPDEEPSVSQLLIISQLILSGVKSAQPKATIDEDDVYRIILSDAETMVNLVNLYTKSQPQLKAESKKNVNPDRRKK
jgi:hypothetical protein